MLSWQMAFMLLYIWRLWKENKIEMVEYWNV